MTLSTIFQFYLGGNTSFIEGGNQSKSSTYILPPMSCVTLGENKWQNRELFLFIFPKVTGAFPVYFPMVTGAFPVYFPHGDRSFSCLFPPKVTRSFPVYFPPR
jgi:hypothetical protein